MKAHLLCMPCTFRAAYDIARRATNNWEIQRRAIIETLKWLSEEGDMLLNITPAIMHTHAPLK
ncbi:MAG: hypothetical protein QXS79_03820 [Candidatus Bathyarchaeia archaeon]